MARFLVLRQEIIDLQEPAVDYNVIKHNPVGSADFVNPNLDVAYLEAWIAVDEATPTILTVPVVNDRYYTAQILDEWGEVFCNLNERNFPDHPNGRFALCAPGSRPTLPDDVLAVELHSCKAKLLARVELKDDWDGAVALQKQFELESMGAPVVQPPVEIELFDNTKLASSEVFEKAEDIINAAPDICPAATEQLAAIREIAAYMERGEQERKEIDEIIEKSAVPQFLDHAVTKAGSFKNNWLGTLTIGNYGTDCWTRTAANLVGIWANSSDEVIYFVGTRDADGNRLDGTRTYRMHFPADAHPDLVVNSYWSIILVGLPDYRVVQNADKRYNLNTYSPLERNTDGSLDLYFSTEPRANVPFQNWLPTPDGAPFSLTLRTYVPKRLVKEGQWFPAPIEVVA